MQQQSKVPFGKSIKKMVVKTQPVKKIDKLPKQGKYVKPASKPVKKPNTKKSEMMPGMDD